MVLLGVWCCWGCGVVGDVVWYCWGCDVVGYIGWCCRVYWVVLLGEEKIIVG